MGKKGGKGGNALLIAEAACFGVIIAAIWLDEIFDIPKYFGAPPSSINWGDALFECGVVAFIAVVIMLLTWKIGAAERRKVEKIVTVCAVCQKVNKNGKWITLDEFIEAGSSGTFTHGICPDCMDTYYGGVTNTTALNFKQFLKNRKSEE